MVNKPIKNNRKGRCFHPNHMVGVQAPPREKERFFPQSKSNISNNQTFFLILISLGNLQPAAAAAAAAQTRKLQGRSLRTAPSSIPF